jgi:hypothetical protein
MHHIVNVFSNQAGFRTPPGDAPPIPKYPPVLSVPDPLKPRLKRDETAETRYLKQRELIDAYKARNPQAPVNKMFEDLTRAHPSVFTDDDGEDDEDGTNVPSDEKRQLAAQREVLEHFQNAHPEMAIDRVYATLTRLNPEFFKD